VPAYCATSPISGAFAAGKKEEGPSPRPLRRVNKEGRLPLPPIVAEEGGEEGKGGGSNLFEPQIKVFCVEILPGAGRGGLKRVAFSPWGGGGGGGKEGDRSFAILAT